MKKKLMAFIAGFTITTTVPSIAQTTDTKVFISGSVREDIGMTARVPFNIKGVKVQLWRMDIAHPMLQITPYPDDSTITDSKGCFKLAAVSAAPYKVTFECKNLISRSFDIQTFKDTSLLVEMKSIDYSASQLIVTPAGPSIKDSLHFELIMSDHCCGTVYRDHRVDVTDTSVVLNFTFDEHLCSEAVCFTNMSSTTFVLRSIKAGWYKVYRSGQLYCPPGSSCLPDYYFPVFVGEFCVVGETEVERIQLPKKTVPYVISRNQIQFSGIQNAHLSIDCFSLSGAFAGSLYNGIVQSDNMSVSLDNKVLDRMSQKTVILRIARDGVVSSELVRK
ncbi:MAG: hypothetical protein GX639_06155 [Fibrobacter sp.]|nr:hypothetical protein [Fibrobacter sp.]